MIHSNHRELHLYVSLFQETNKCEQLKHLKNAPSLWSLKQNLNFLYILLSNEVISCTPLLLQTGLLFPFIWPRSATRPRKGSGRLVISLPRQWSLSPPISRKGPAPAAGEASPSWRLVLGFNKLEMVRWGCRTDGQEEFAEKVLPDVALDLVGWRRGCCGFFLLFC